MDVILPLFQKLLDSLSARQGSTSLRELVYLYALKALEGKQFYEDNVLHIILESDSTLTIFSKSKVDVEPPFPDVIEKKVFSSRESLILFYPGHWTSYLLNNCSWDYDPSLMSPSSSKKD